MPVNRLKVAKAKKFGSFSGVFTPSILAILGVIMYLRMPWIVGQAGLWATLGIILVAHIISISTGLSVASVATDKRVETGGSYYIISRSLGLPIGGTLGVALYIGLSFSVSLYLLGFAETLLSTFGMELSLANIRLAGAVMLIIVAAITFISTSLAIKSQYLIMAAIVLSLLSVFFGSHEHTPDVPFMGTADGALPWITLFAIFFPAVTGFQAGVSMSGDLKDPRKNIPVGTIMAILVGLLVYTGLALFFAFTVDRELLINDQQILFHISRVPALVVAGILAATLSSAMVSILGAPRILQAVAMDRILPGFFARGYGASNEPRNALLFTFLIALTGILIGELNVIARIVTIFFIIIYGFLNITYAIESWAGSDFMPSFKIPRIVSIIGALACIVVMIQLDLIALIVASVLLIALFLLLKKKELTLQTGDTWTGVWSSLVKTGLAKLNQSSKKTRNWRPNVMLFSGGEKSRPHLIDMGKALVGKLGVFTNFELAEEPGGEVLSGIKGMAFQNNFRPVQKGVFTRRHSCRDVYEGIDVISRVYGFTGFEPNTVLMGWARNTRNPEKFAGLVSSLKRQDYNCAFLSYDKEKGFGEYKKIDFWWSGSGRGLTLALHLLRFITSSQSWRTAAVRVLVINNDSSRTDSIYSLISQMLENYRMKADVKVINNGVEKLPAETITGSESRLSDLTLIELPLLPGKESRPDIDKANVLCGSVGSALLISPSSFFDSVGILEEEAAEEEKVAEDTGRPVADIFKNLEVPSREIISNEVYNIGRTASGLLEKYFEQGLERTLKLDSKFYSELQNFTLRTLESLEKSINQKASERPKTFLRILNDFSFHSQRQVQLMKEQRVESIVKIIGEANTDYLDRIRAMQSIIPESLRIKLGREELRINKDDHFKTRFYKAHKLLLAFITRRQVTHKVRVTTAARFFLYHRRLWEVHQLMAEYTIHSFSEVVEIRKLLNGLHELIEKSSLETDTRHRVQQRIRLEKDRLEARLKVMENESRNFHYNAGRRLYESLHADLQQFGYYLDSTGANIRSRKFAPFFRNDPGLVEDIESFSVIWSKNIGAFINKALLDFYVLSLKSRIHSKIRKYQNDFRTALEVNMMRKIEKFEGFAYKLPGKESKKLAGIERLDHESLVPPPVLDLYHGLYAEIGELLKDIPEKIEISGERITEKIKESAFSETPNVVVGLRKTVEYYIGTELIDFSVKKAGESERQLHKLVDSIKDLVRLLNFSLDNETKDDAIAEQAQKEEQSRLIIANFLDKLKGEKNKISNITGKLETAFDQGLKNAFDPLSSATISKSSLVVKRAARDADQKGLSGRLHKQWERIRDIARKSFVDLLYSKSEGKLWISSRESGGMTGYSSNSRLLSFVEAVTPADNLLKDLPFYYSSLFSGQSGTGDDFWVGMNEEESVCRRAIGRFKAGFPGALLITGLRSSGKSSLSRRVAEHHFGRENTYSLRAPKDCSADISLFTEKLLETLNAHNRNLDDVLRALPAGKAVIIQDLGLWWERRPGGDRVIKKLMDLIDHFGHKCFFIINVNSHALGVIERQTGIGRYALATVQCEAFDARELKDMIMLRHQAGGMKFRYDKRDEERMSEWDYARLFNDLFEISYGNPGTATILWLSAIKKVSGKTLIMHSLKMPDKKAFELLTPGQWFYLSQFIIHRRFNAESLSRILDTPVTEVRNTIRGLMRAGILIEKFDGIYAIRPGLDLYLIEQLNHRKRL